MPCYTARGVRAMPQFHGSDHTRGNPCRLPPTPGSHGFWNRLPTPVKKGISRIAPNGSASPVSSSQELVVQSIDGTADKGCHGMSATLPFLGTRLAPAGRPDETLFRERVIVLLTLRVCQFFSVVITLRVMTSACPASNSKIRNVLRMDAGLHAEREEYTTDRRNRSPAITARRGIAS